MKKITTLLALGCALCSTAFAAVPTAPAHSGAFDLSKYELTPEGKQLVNTMQARAAAGLDVNQGGKKIIHKSYEDNSYVWECTVSTNSSNWYDVLQKQDGTKPTFYEVPYYWVNYYLTATRKSDGASVTSICIPLLWPTYYMWEQSRELLEAGVDLDSMPEEDRNMEMVTNIDLFDAVWPDDKVAKAFIYGGSMSPYYGDSTNSWLGFFEMAPNEWYSQDSGWPQTYNNASTWILAGDQSKMSQVTFSSWDSEERTYQLENTLFFNNGSTLNLNFDGEARMMGFIPENYDLTLLTPPHVVYCGVEDGESLEFDNTYSSFDWGPFAKFFVMGATGNCEAVVRSGQTVFDQQWESSFGVAVAEGEEDSYGFYAGFLFKPADTAATDPYGWWDMKEPNIEYNDRTGAYEGNDMEPRLNQLIPAGYNESYMPWADTKKGDCFYMVKDRYYVYLQEYTRFCIGDKKYGIFLYGQDNYNNTYWGTYSGKIILHPDPKNLDNVVEIESMQNIDSVEGIATEDVRVMGGNGVITIVADADVTDSIYTLAGAVVKTADVKAGKTLNVAVENGVYVVKAGNTVKKLAI